MSELLDICWGCDYRKQHPTYESYCMKKSRKPEKERCNQFRTLPMRVYDEPDRFRLDDPEPEMSQQPNESTD